MNYLIPENTDKKLVTVHNGKEKGKEKIEENKTNQVKSEKKLKTIKLNLKPIENKSQKNKFMSTGRPSGHSVSTRTQESQHIMQKMSTQLGIPIYTSRRIIDHESTHKVRTYYRSTPIDRNDRVSRHMNLNVSTHNNGEGWIR